MFFQSPNVRYLETMKNGCEYIVLLLKLQLLSINENGRLAIGDRPYTPLQLARMTGHALKFVQGAIPIFKELGLLEVQGNGTIYVPDIPNLVGKSSGEADRQREYQRRKKEDAISCEKMR
ncbi:MAG: phage replisome organizer N-terminal domain-containing protein [Oscillospiraceae bacterium]